VGRREGVGVKEAHRRKCERGNMTEEFKEKEREVDRM
jgi:hypothetical protein